MREAVTGYVACQPVAYQTPPGKPDFTSLPEFPFALDPLQLPRAAMADYAVKARETGHRLHRLVLRLGGHPRPRDGAGPRQAPGRRARLALAAGQADVGLRVLRACRTLRCPTDLVVRDDLRRDYRAIVVGLGGIGSGAAYWLAGASGPTSSGSSNSSSVTIGASPRTIRGSSGSRITRRATSASPRPPTRRGRRSRPSLGEQLILRTGGLDLWPAGRRDPDGRATRRASPPRTCPSSCLDADEVMRRWPQWRLDDGTAGDLPGRRRASLRPRAATAAHQQLARAHGATLLDRMPVDRVRAASRRGGGDDVRRRDLPGEPLGLAAGPWSNDILGPLGIDLPLTITREQVTYFATPRTWRRSRPSASRSGSGWTIRRSTASPPSAKRAPRSPRIAGAPRRPRTGDVRARRGRLCAASTPSWPRTCPRRSDPLILTKTCLYTLTPDRDFVIDRLPGTRT